MTIDNSALRACDVYDAALWPRPGGRAVQALRVLGVVVTRAFLGLLSEPSLRDLVVRRRADGVEVLRIPAGDPEAAADLLSHVQRQLAALPAEGFAQKWALGRAG